MSGYRVLANSLVRGATRTLRNLLATADGAAAVEFALVVPALATMVLGISQISSVVVGSANMQTGARAGVQYVLNGGADMTTAQNVALQAWQQKPNDATISASEYCTCDGATTVCTQTCANGDAPEKYVAVTATGTLGGTVYAFNKTLTETARIR